jgi:hypothetical protein
MAIDRLDQAARATFGGDDVGGPTMPSALFTLPPRLRTPVEQSQADAGSFIGHGWAVLVATGRAALWPGYGPIPMSAGCVLEDRVVLDAAVSQQEAGQA